MSDHADAIRKRLGEILSYDYRQICRKADDGGPGFAVLEPTFNDLQQLAEELSNLPFEKLPHTKVDWSQINGKLKETNQALSQIASFDALGSGDSKGDRERLINDLEEAYYGLRAAFYPHIPYLLLQSTSLREMSARVNDLFREVRDSLDEQISHIEEQRKSIDSIEESAREAVSNIGVSKFATIFEGVAKTHEKLSRNWLITSTVLGVATLSLTGFLAYMGPAWPKSKLPEGSNWLPFVLTKFVFLSVLYFVAFWSSKNYKAHRHLGVVNRHRQNALSTFQAFVEGSDDQQTRDAVLLEATRCIFSPGVTGYLGNEPEPPSNRIIEIVKSLGGSN